MIAKTRSLKNSNDRRVRDSEYFQERQENLKDLDDMEIEERALSIYSDHDSETPPIEPPCGLSESMEQKQEQAASAAEATVMVAPKYFYRMPES